MAAAAQHIKNNRSDEDIFLSFATDVKIKSIEKVKDNIIIKTYPIIVDDGIISENWIKLYFMIDYNMKHEKAIEHLIDLGCDKFENVSKLDFFKIIATGRKLYKFIVSEAESNIKAVKRTLNLENYDDVRKIRSAYSRKVREYKNMKSDIEMYQERTEDNRDKFITDKEKLEKYTILLNTLKNN